MTHDAERLKADRAAIAEAQQRGFVATVLTYTRLSGPGWLQSALTLGGGSLASSLYLGVLVGFGMLWLQPLAMILGIIMLSAIGYVTLSSGERPLRAINEHVNPVLGWGWVIATMAANMVWCLPQFSLANAVVQQNLLPGVLGPEAMDDTTAKMIISGAILIITITITWAYDSGSWGVRLYEWMLKILVGAIVACFIGVVIRLSLSSGGLDWNAVLAGFVPDFGKLFEPADGFQPLLAEIADKAGQQAHDFWAATIVGQQRDVMISAAATAVGINMTFLLPYSMLARGWTKEFRGLAIFDLSTGMFIPFVLATSCVTIAAATQFHAVPAPGLLGEVDEAGQLVEPRAGMVKAFDSMLERRLADEEGAETLSRLKKESPEKVAADVTALDPAEKRLAAMLVSRDAGDLALSLEPLTGSVVANVIFGLGVLGMTLSTITILMLISGFVVCEVLDLPATGWPHRFGTLAATTGALGPFVWTGKAQFWLAVPTSVFGMMLLPIAYLTFFLLMNQKSLLGDELPRGGRRVAWNVLMAVAAGTATAASLVAVWSKAGYYGIGGMAAFVGLALIVQAIRWAGDRPARQ